MPAGTAQIAHFILSRQKDREAPKRVSQCFTRHAARKHLSSPNCYVSTRITHTFTQESVMKFEFGQAVGVDNPQIGSLALMRTISPSIYNAIITEVAEPKNGNNGGLNIRFVVIAPGKDAHEAAIWDYFSFDPEHLGKLARLINRAMGVDTTVAGWGFEPEDLVGKTVELDIVAHWKKEDRERGEKGISKDRDGAFGIEDWTPTADADVAAVAALRKRLTADQAAEDQALDELAAVDGLDY